MRGFALEYQRMKYRFTTVTIQEGEWFIARAIELGVVSQGKTALEAQRNLREAVELYLEHEKVSPGLLSQRPPLVSSLDVEYA